MKYSKLFSPLKVGSCVFPNRIMSTAAVTRLAAEDGHITEAFTERYQRLAKGGLGSMVVEAAVVLPSRSSFNLRVSDDQFIPELKEFVEGLREVNRDLKIGLQLIHFLKLSRSGWRQRVEDLKAGDIKVVPGQFASGAQRAKTAGFDFVEIHMAHFTTLASFLSLANKRKDGYGGDFEGRMMLPTEVVRAVREAAGDDFTVGMRMNGEEFVKEGNTLLQSARIAKRLAKVGVDYISVSAGERFEDAAEPEPGFPPFAGTGYSGSRMSPRWWNPDGVHVYLAEGIRKAVRDAGYDIPIITAGKIRTPEFAEELLGHERTDIVGMVRALFCDPDFPKKSKEDRAGEIVKCAACGYCSELDEAYKTVLCAQWPEGVLHPPDPFYLVPPCEGACPAGVNIRNYIEAIALGKYEEALDIIEEKIPLPGTVGRVCPRFCEVKCNRGEYDDSVSINGLKRFAADTVASRGGRGITPAARTKPERVAIVGSGPAGLSAAVNLMKAGYGVTVFEAAGVPGGMLAMGIPKYRLPREILDREIEDINRLGVEIRLNSPINGDRSLDDLKKQGYKAIFIAAGAHKSTELGIPNENVKGIVSGTAWLKKINLGSDAKVGEKVVVIGGGNVAIDSARMALRLGAKDVTIAYRRSVDEMPAITDEIEAAEKEGVKFKFHSSPCQIVCEGDECVGLECLATELGEPDESGRRRPITVQGSEFVIDADMVILAIGESPDLSFLGRTKLKVSSNNRIQVNPNSMTTSVDGIFAGGDVVSGPATVVEAIGAGRRAAKGIEKYLNGDSLDFELTVPDTIAFDDLNMEGVKKRKRQRMSCLAPKKRIRGFREVDLGFSEIEALGEADRCLQCGMFPRMIFGDE